MSVHFPKPLFTRTELWYHLLMMPLLFPAGNYLFLRERYFTDPAVFGWGTLLVFGLYGFSLVILTIVVKVIIQQYPDMRQARQRNLVTMLAVTTLTVGLAVFDVWAYSLFPVFERPFLWDTVRAIVLLGVVFDMLLCLVLGIQYTYSRWQENQTEKEQLKRAALQQDFDELKQQINPGFLFNSLTSLKGLISQDQQQAGAFVDHLSKVYRYLLNSTNQPFTTLDAEMAFVNSYVYLLNTRYQSSISLQIDIESTQRSANLLPLSLQLLLDYAIPDNVVHMDKPLTIGIRTTPVGGLQVLFKHPHRSANNNQGTDELATLLAKYKMVPAPAMTVVDNDSCFTITLPLHMEGTIVTS